MTTPEQNEPQRLNEPEHLQAEGYLNRTLRRLGEGLGSYVFEKIRDKGLLVDEERSIVTRDLSVIFGKMEPPQNWNRLGLGPDEWNRMGLLIGFRNGPWAHLKGYSDYDVHQCLGDAARLLEAIAADEQAQGVWQMWSELGKLLFNQSTPERPRNAESDELRQRISELEKRFSELMNQQEGESASTDMLAGDDKAVPDFFSGKIRLGLSDEEYSQAIAGINEVLRIDPVNVSAYIDRAKVHVEKGKWELAVSDYTTALQLDSDNAPVYIDRGNLYYGPIGDIDSAIDDYAASLRLNRDDRHTYVRRALAYYDKGEYDSAIADYDAALQLDSQSEYAIYILRARAYARKGEYDSAIDDYSAAIRLNPNDEVLYIIRGNAYRYGKEDYDSAIADYSAALKIRPDCELAYVERGNTHAKRGEWGLAIVYFGAALQCFKPGVGGWEDPTNDYCMSITYHNPSMIDADQGETYFGRANAYIEIGEYDWAISDLTAVLQLDPFEHRNVSDANVYYIRSVVYANTKKYDQAIADIEKAIELTRNGELAERLGKVRDEIIHLRDETTEYDQHIEESPDDPEGWYLRGVHFLFDVEDNERAFVDFSKAIELNPDFAEAYYYRAWVWRRRGDHGKAIIDFSQAIAIRPDYAAAYQHRGISYFDIGDRDNAQADFEMARSLGYEP